MENDSTGDVVSKFYQPSNTPTIVMQGDVSGLRYSDSLSTSGNRTTGSTNEFRSKKKRESNLPLVVSPTTKHKAYAILTSCVENLDRAIDCTNDDDVFDKSNSLDSFKTCLSDLWDLRSEREEVFEEIINMIQGITIDRDLDCFDRTQLICIRICLLKLRDEPDCDDELANQITLDLMKGGLDAFREIE